MAKTINYVEEIRDIVTGKKLPPAQRDLVELSKALSFLKANVLYELAQRAVAGDEKIRDEILAAKGILEQRLETLRAEMQETQEQGADTKLSNSATHDKMQQLIESMDTLVEQTGSPEEFIKAFIEEYTKAPLDSLGNKVVYHGRDTLKNLLLRCADGLRDISGNMESARIGEDSDPSAGYNPGRMSREVLRRLIEEAGEFEPNYGVNLFVNRNGETVPVKKNIETFLSLIRDPELLGELENHCDASEKKLGVQKELKTATANLETQTQKREVLSNEEVREQLEKYFKDVLEARKEYSSADKESQKMDNAIAVQRGLFANMWYHLSGAHKEDKEKQEVAKENSKMARSKLKAVESTHREAQKTNPIYAQLYDIYMDFAISHDKKGLEMPALEDALTKLSQERGEQSIYSVIAPIINIDAHIDEAQARVETLSQQLPGLEQAEREAFEALSPRAKEIIAETPRGYVRTHGLRSKYIDRTMSVDNRVSTPTPPVATLILEALLNRRDLHTEEQLLEYGVSFTDEELLSYTDAVKTMKRSLDRKLQELKKVGEKDVEGIDF